MSHTFDRHAATLSWLLVISLLLLSSCKGRPGASDRKFDDGSGERVEEAVPVEVEELQTGRLEAMLRFSTTLEAELEVKVLAEAPRQVRQLLVEEGDKVRRGQVLVRLEDEVQKSALNRVRTDLARVRREHDRQRSLHDRGLTSDQALHDITSELEKLELAIVDSQREVDWALVKAPIGGVVTQRIVKVGDYVNINQHLFDVVDFDSIVARIFVPEKELPRLTPGLNAVIVAEASGGSLHPAIVDRIAPLVDAATGTVKVTLSIPDTTGLLPGMFCTVQLTTEVHEEAILVPKRALVYDNEQAWVFRLGEDRRVEKIAIQPRLEGRDVVEPEAGLAAGDQIVTAGQAGLKHGSLVRLPGDPIPVDPTDEEDDES